MALGRRVMRLNKDFQYSLLFVLYLCQAGRAKLDDASYSLQIPKGFLEQLARKLRIAGVVESVRGPGGGYELRGDPTVRDVMNAISPVKLLAEEEQTKYQSGLTEHRALLQFAKNLNSAMSIVLSRTVRNVGRELVANELAVMNTAVFTSRMN
jgi:Rrf2 family protein